MFKQNYFCGGRIVDLAEALEEFIQLYLDLAGAAKLTVLPNRELAIIHELDNGLELSIPWTEFVRDFLPQAVE